MSDNKKDGSHTKTSSVYNAATKQQKTSLAPSEILPTGVLAIHVKRCRNLKLIDAGAKNFSKRLPVSLYMKICVGDLVKMTTVNDARCANNSAIMFDDLKHFMVMVNNRLDDESNKVTIALMGFQGKDKHRKLGEKEVHLFNIIKNLFIVDTLELTKNAHVMGEVELEMAFSYGCFGYGHSSQLESKHHTPAEQVGHSLFLRVEPPADRKHETRDVSTCIPVPHPPFINWPVKVNIGMSGRDYMTESITELITRSKDKSNVEDYPNLVTKMEKRMPELQKKYAQITKRSQRIAFLQSLVTTKISPELEDHDEILYPESDQKELSDTSLAEAVVTDAEDQNRGILGYFRKYLRWIFRRASFSSNKEQDYHIDEASTYKIESERVPQMLANSPDENVPMIMLTSPTSIVNKRNS